MMMSQAMADDYGDEPGLTSLPPSPRPPLALLVPSAERGAMRRACRNMARCQQSMGVGDTAMAARLHATLTLTLYA